MKKRYTIKICSLATDIRGNKNCILVRRTYIQFCGVKFYVYQ